MEYNHQAPRYAERSGTGNPLPKRGQIKAKIFEEIISSLAPVSTAGDSRRHEGNDVSRRAPANSP